MVFKKKIILCLLLPFFILSGCDLIPTLSLSTANVTVPSSASQAKVFITTNTEWNITGMNQWCTVSPESGKGSTEITISVSQNTTKEARSNKLHISAGGLSSSLDITQKQDDAIILSKKTLSFPQGGGSVVVELRSNVEYEVIIPQEITWVTEITSRAMITFSHNLYISANDTYSSREAKIVFRDKKSSLADTLTITQAQKDGLILTNKNAEIPFWGGTVDLELQSNIQYDIILPPGISWITRAATKALSLYNHQFIVSPNSDYQDRSAIVIFKDKNSQLADTLRILQFKKELLQTGSEIFYVEKEGGSVSLSLSSNVEYTTTTTGGGWINQIPGSGGEGTPLSFSINANSSSEDRTGKIIFISVSGKTSDTVAVVQSGTPGYFLLLKTGERIENLIPAGSLSSVRQLRLEGEVDSENITFIGNNMSSLEALDLQKCTLSGNTIPSAAFKTNPPAVRKLKSISFPQTLRSIGAEAFYSCRDLTAPALPQGFTQIGAYAFAYCSSITAIDLPSSVSSIGDYAFYNCSSLSSVRSHIESPFPVSNSFYGVNRDCELVVNPGTLTAYRSAGGWGDGGFRLIYEEGSHPGHYLSLDRYALVSGGRSNTQSVILSCSTGWTLENKPEWVVLSATSGRGEETINVTFSSNVGNPVRNGEIIFKTGDGLLRAALAVTQYGNAYSDGQYMTLQRATVGDGVNIVFMGDGYTMGDISTGAYDNAINQAVSHFFAAEPYTTYRNYFNVHVVYVFSQESGVSDISVTRNTALKVKYEEAQPSTHMSLNEMTCFNYADNAPVNLSKTLIVVVANSSRYGGTTYMWSSGHAIAVCPVSSSGYPYDFRGVVQHEAGGHGFGGCADEYVNKTGTIPLDEKNDLTVWQGLGFFLNVSVTGALTEVPWKHFIGVPGYSRVSAWQGAYYYPLGVWRPEESSCMINNIRYFNAPSREMIVKKIMSRAGMPYSFDDFKSRDVIPDVVATKAATKPDPEKILHPPVLFKGRPAGQ